MRSRQVTLFVEPEIVPELVETMVNDVVPIFRAMPHFLGFTILRDETGPRTEVIAMSYWDDGLEDSAEVSGQFIERIRSLTGASPSRRSFDILHASMRNGQGGFHEESPDEQ